VQGVHCRPQESELHTKYLVQGVHRPEVQLKAEEGLQEVEEPEKEECQEGKRNFSLRNPSEFE
jgi:hypothetical protein